MIKAAATLDDGTLLVVLGLSDGNEEELRKDRPIVFSLKELHGPDWDVCLTFEHHDGKAACPQGFKGGALAFDGLDLLSMRDVPVRLECNGVKFCVFRGTDEATMERQMRGLIDARTKVTRSGYAPSDLPPGQN